jgi:hypothetical protein
MKLERIAGLAFILSLLLAVFTESAESAVTLIYFRGTGLDEAVNLEWATGTEFNTAGFRIKRAIDSFGPYEFVTSIGFVPAEGDGIIGGEYSAIDSDFIVNGTTYYYILVEIETNSSENDEGPISVIAGLVAPTSTSSPTATPIPITTTSANTATPTLVASGTGAPSSGSPTMIPTPTSDLDTVDLNAGTATSVSAEDQTEDESVEFATDDIAMVNQVPSPTDPGGYPAPSGPNPLPPQETGDRLRDAYPEPAIPSNVPTTYPEPLGDPARTDPAIIQPFPGSGIEDVESIGVNGTAESDTATSESQRVSSTIFLWLGFIIALLIFLAGVYGSIVLFTRQRSRGD